MHLIGVDGFEGESAGLSLVDKGVLDATIQTPDFGGLSYEIARKTFLREIRLRKILLSSRN